MPETGFNQPKLDGVDADPALFDWTVQSGGAYVSVHPDTGVVTALAETPAGTPAVIKASLIDALTTYGEVVEETFPVTVLPAPSGGVLVGIQALIDDDLGGDANVLAFWDSRLGITEAAGKVTGWDDARGAGFPALIGDSGTEPDWISASTLVRFDGAAQMLRTAVHAMWHPDDVGGLVYGGTATPGTEDGRNAWLVRVVGEDAGGTNYYWALVTQKSGPATGVTAARAYDGAGAIQPSLALVPSAAERRQIGARHTAGTHAVAPRVADMAEGGEQTLANGFGIVDRQTKLQLMGGDAGFHGDGDCRYVIVLAAALTQAQSEAIAAWGAANHAVTVL
jgi:hypothetical protein